MESVSDPQRVHPARVGVTTAGKARGLGVRLSYLHKSWPLFEPQFPQLGLAGLQEVVLVEASALQTASSALQP